MPNLNELKELISSLSLYWRHKILEAIGKQLEKKRQKLKGISDLKTKQGTDFL